MTSLLRWAGIAFDEGPNEGGQYGPYVQVRLVIIIHVRSTSFM